MIAVLDTGAVDALGRGNERSRARLRALRSRADDIVLPAAVLAEGVLTGHPGRDHHISRLLRDLRIVDVDALLGHAAGGMRVRALRSGGSAKPSGVDAIVAAVADDLASNDIVQIVTTDPDDLRQLAAVGHHAPRIAIHRV